MALEIVGAFPQHLLEPRDERLVLAGRRASGRRAARGHRRLGLRLARALGAGRGLARQPDPQRLVAEPRRAERPVERAGADEQHRDRRPRRPPRQPARRRNRRGPPAPRRRRRRAAGARSRPASPPPRPRSACRAPGRPRPRAAGRAAPARHSSSGAGRARRGGAAARRRGRGLRAPAPPRSPRRASSPFLPRRLSRRTLPRRPRAHNGARRPVARRSPSYRSDRRMAESAWLPLKIRSKLGPEPGRGTRAPSLGRARGPQRSKGRIPMAKVSMTVNGRAVERATVEGRTLLVEFLREGLRAHRHACRLRHRAVRRLRRARRRGLGEGLQRLRARRRRAPRSHDRGHGQRRRQPRRAPGGVPGRTTGCSAASARPGMVMTAAALLRRTPSPSEAEIREYLEGNICRCTGYHNIVKAIQAAAAELWRRAACAARVANDGSRGRTTCPRTAESAPACKRREDVRFLTGKGRYTDDLNRPGQAYVAFLRSDVAHGRISRRRHQRGRGDAGGVCRSSPARTSPDVGGIPCGWQVTDRYGQPMQEPKHPMLAAWQGPPRRRPDRRGRRRDARRRPATRPRRSSSTSRSCRRSSTCARRSRPTRRRCTTSSPPTSASTGASSRTTSAAVDAAIEAAHHVTTLELVNNRLVANPMEPRVRDRRVRRRRRPAHALDHQPEPARDPAADGRLRARHPRAQAAGGGAGRRRRLRLEDLPLRRGGVRHLRRQGAGAAGEVDLDAAPRRSCPTRTGATT